PSTSTGSKGTGMSGAFFHGTALFGSASLWRRLPGAFFVGNLFPSRGAPGPPCLWCLSRRERYGNQIRPAENVCRREGMAQVPLQPDPARHFQGEDRRIRADDDPAAPPSPSIAGTVREKHFAPDTRVPE